MAIQAKLCNSFQEISRLASQLRRLYGSNKKATRPFHIFLTNMSDTSRLYKECLRMNDGFLNYVVIIVDGQFGVEVFFIHLAIENKQNPIFQMEITEENCQDLFPSKTMVYLSPDAEEG